VPDGAWGACLSGADRWLAELHGHVLHDFGIPIRGVQADVTEPAANHIDIQPRFEEMDRRRMSEDMRTRRSMCGAGGRRAVGTLVSRRTSL
jgi:hypothetical protein